MLLNTALGPIIGCLKHKLTFLLYSGDPEIGPPMGLTESGPILESVQFVKPANCEWRGTSQSVYRYALLCVDIQVDY